MASLSTYFVNNKEDLQARNDCIIFGSNYRITVLTERLVRLEYSKTGTFEDRPTTLVVSRKFPKPEFSATKIKGVVQIKTKYFTLNYLENKSFIGSKLTPGNTLNIKLNNTERFWYYKNKEVRRLETISTSLDNNNFKEDKGLFSLDGFASIDDSNSLVIENDTFIKRDNNNIDIYVFIYGKDFGACLKDYFILTGKPSIPPRYALGNWWYKNKPYNEEEILSVVNKFKENHLPLSVFLLGDAYQEQIYTKNETLIPNLTNLSNTLLSNNIKLGLTINPNMPITPSNYQYQTIKQALELKKDKDINLIPFNPKTLGMYFKLYINNLINMGIDIFNIDYLNNNDLNDLFLLNHYHYAISNTEAKRGMILSRNAKIAPHRYPIIFTGKTKVSWDTLNYLPSYTSQSANIGVSFISHAIGGYYDGIEDNELYLRYIELGTFSPILMISSDNGKYYKREPWNYDMGTLKIISEYLNLRNRLIPYIYSESYNYYKNGIPLILPLYYRYPNILDEPMYKNEYYFGRNMLVVPITKKKDIIMNRVVQRLFIPEGIWYDFKTGKKFPGNKYYVSFYKDEDYPVFCQAGSIIPMSLNEGTSTPTDLELHIFPGATTSYNLCEDDGKTNLFKEGYFINTSIEYNYLANNYTLIIRPIEGKTNIISEYRNYKIRFRNIKESNQVIVYENDKLLDNITSYKEDNDFIVTINHIKTTSQLTINCMGKDIEIDASRLINEEIESILMDLEIETKLKEKIDSILFSNLPIKKKRIEIRKLKKYHLEEKFIKMFIKLLEYINEI